MRIHIPCQNCHKENLAIRYTCEPKGVIRCVGIFHFPLLCKHCGYAIKLPAIIDAYYNIKGVPTKRIEHDIKYSLERNNGKRDYV